MKNNKGLISIIMNCYNGDKYLKEAIQSIINQKYKNWELIFWNNNSKDNSERIFKSFKDKRLKYFYRKKKVSLYISRNAAIKKANGEYVAFLDVDDSWTPDKLSLQVKKFKNKKVGLVYGNYIKVNEYNFIKKKKLISKKKLPQGYIFKKLIKNYNVGLLTIIIRKKFIIKYKEIFKVKYNYLGDLDFVLRFSLKHKFAAIQKPIGYYRAHSNQMQKKFYKIKSDQFTIWLKDIKASKIFGKKVNLEQFEEWERFFFNLTAVKEKRNFKNLMNILKYPNNLNKLKLLIIFFIPKFISQMIVTET